MEGITALHAAVIHGHRDVAELLLKHGADVSLPIKIHPDAMSFAFLSGSHDPQVIDMRTNRLVADVVGPNIIDV